MLTLKEPRWKQWREKNNYCEKKHKGDGVKQKTN